MKNINVEGGGFPGTSKTWRFIAEMIAQNSELINNIAGDNTIVSGLEADGASAVTHGLVVLGGEFYPVQGGNVSLESAYIAITEDVEQTQYLKDENGDGAGDLIDTYFERYAVVTSQSAGNVKLTSLARIGSLKQMSKRIPPVKTALPYFGSIAGIPEGWQLCDGSNGTPDLRGKFVVGLDQGSDDYESVGQQGGEAKHTLSLSEMPRHMHSGSTNSGGSHQHGYKDSYFIENTPNTGYESEYAGANLKGSGDTDNDNSYIYYRNRYTESAGSHTHSLSLNFSGSSQAHENRPPYYTIAYIAYTGN